MGYTNEQRRALKDEIMKHTMPEIENLIERGRVSIWDTAKRKPDIVDSIVDCWSRWGETYENAMSLAETPSSYK